MIKKIVLRVLFGLLLCIVLLCIVFSIPSVQTRLGTYISQRLENTFGITIKVSKIDFSYLGKVDLKEIYIADYRGDTLIAAQSLQTSLLGFTKIFSGEIHLGYTFIEGGMLHLRTYKNESQNNMMFFVNKLASDTIPSDKPFILKASLVDVKNCKVIVENENKPPSNIVFYKNIIASVLNFQMIDYNVKGQLRNCKTVDHFGLQYTDFQTDYSYTNSKMRGLNSKIKTKTSYVEADVFFDYTWDDLDYFADKVKTKINIKESDVSFEDLCKFYDVLKSPEHLNIRGDIKGTLNNLDIKNFRAAAAKDLFILEGNYKIQNYFKTWNDFQLQGNIKKLNTDFITLKKYFPVILGKYLPKEIMKFGAIELKSQKDFVYNHSKINTNIKVKTSMGKITTNIAFEKIQNKDSITYDGQIKLDGFDLGRFINDKYVGKISLITYVQGVGFTKKSINTTIKGLVKTHQYKGYTYKNIRLDGVFKNHFFDGRFSINDPNIKMDFKGLANFSSNRYKFNFYTDVAYANFSALNLYKGDEIAKVSGTIKMNIQGNSLDNLTGEVSFKNASYTNVKKQYKFTDFKISSNDLQGVRKITIDSKDIVNGYVEGRFKPSKLPAFFKENFKTLINGTYKTQNLTDKEYIKFDFDIYNQFINALFPNILIAENTHFKGEIIPEKKLIKCRLKSPKIKLKKLLLDSIHLSINNKNPNINAYLEVKKIKIPYYNIENFSILNKTLKDTLFIHTDFVGGKKLEDTFQISTYYTSEKSKDVLGLKKSKIHFKNVDWLLNPLQDEENKIVYNWANNHFDIKKCMIVTQEDAQKKIVFTGDDKQMSLKISDIDLNALMPSRKELDFIGLLNGEFLFTKEGKAYSPKGYLKIKKFGLNGYVQGDLLTQITAPNHQQYDIFLQISKQNKFSLKGAGAFYMDKKLSLEIDIFLSNFELSLLNALGGQGTINNIKGFANGNAKLKGFLENIKMQGDIALNRAGFAIPYLNTHYRLQNNTHLHFQDNNIVLNDITLKDTLHQTKASLNGHIQHKSFSNIFLDLNVKTPRFMVLNTRDKKNVSYYGKGFISGDITLKGFTNTLDIDIKAKVLKGTDFYIPLNLNNGQDVDTFSLIHFKKKDEVKNSLFDIEKQNTLPIASGTSLNFDLEITKDAMAQMVIDRIYGSYLKVSGVGNLSITLDKLGKFQINGEYAINQGTYNLIYQGFINKPFKIQSNGVIAWTGDPLNANLSLSAIHSVKANPKVLLENLKTSRKIPVDLLVNIKGSLLNSFQKFDILIPNANPMVNSELAFKLKENGENGKMRQFFSLLLSNSFYSESGTDTYQANTLKQTTSELISSTVSSLLNLNNNIFQIDLGYVSGERDEITKQNIDNQLDISLNTHINDRILINGNLGVPVGGGAKSSIIGEFNVDLLLDEQGDLRWTFFNRRNEVQYSAQQQEGYTQGTGFTYQINFNIIKDIFYKLGLNKENKK